MKITHCKLKKSIQKKLLEFFMLEVTARSAADLLVIQPNSAILFYRKIREVISYHLALEADEVFDGQIELDESYFDGTRKGKRGRGAVGKTAVFGLLKRDGKVYTVVVPNTQSATLLPIIREKVKPDSIVYTDFYRSYDVLDVSEFNHFRINHSTHFAEKQNHINGIENFWNQAKRHLRKFNCIPKAHFELYLKECEWRFNHSNLKSQISILKQLVKGSLS
ncbi:IS1595 family transposase [Glaesserella parasuis]|uniref:IS1595 family transposase n=4 Tax=Glaesserella parasuis TaxID=738 RepID=UPI0039FD9C86